MRLVAYQSQIKFRNEKEKIFPLLQMERWSADAVSACGIIAYGVIKVSDQNSSAAGSGVLSFSHGAKMNNNKSTND